MPRDISPAENSRCEVSIPVHGYKSARTVKKYGIRLLPELFEHLNPMPFEAAAQMDKDLAEDLRAQGFTVTGGT